jgi:predicted metalloendopeptidase
MSVPFNTFLTNEYVKRFENPQAMEYTKTLCNDLKIVFKRILERNAWLQPSTKKYALKKLDSFVEPQTRQQTFASFVSKSSCQTLWS